MRGGGINGHVGLRGIGLPRPVRMSCSQALLFPALSAGMSPGKLGLELGFLPLGPHLSYVITGLGNSSLGRSEQETGQRLRIQRRDEPKALR